MKSVFNIIKGVKIFVKEKTLHRIGIIILSIWTSNFMLNSFLNLETMDKKSKSNIFSLRTQISIINDP